jgi:hypothetical protein
MAAAGKRPARASAVDLQNYLRERLPSIIDPNEWTLLRHLSVDDQRAIGLCIMMQQFVGHHGPEVELFKREANVVLRKSGVGTRCHAMILEHKEALQALVRYKVYPEWAKDLVEIMFEPLPSAAVPAQAINSKCARLDALLLPNDGAGLIGRLVDRYFDHIQ